VRGGREAQLDGRAEKRETPPVPSFFVCEERGGDLDLSTFSAVQPQFFERALHG